MDIDQHVNQIVQNIVAEITTKVQAQAMDAITLKIDEVMSAVSAKAYDTNITYTYVISAEKDKIDWASMSKHAAYDADELICGDAVSNLMVKSGATYSYLYLDKNGRKVGAATVGKCHSKN